MVKNLVWNIFQFVADSGLVLIVLYRAIVQLNSVVRPDSTERIIQINQPYSILQLPSCLSSQFTTFCFIFCQLTTFNQNFLIQALDQIFSSSLVSFSRSSTKTKTLITLVIFFGGIRFILVYLMIILNIVEDSRQGRGFIC
ncbi:Hypothetical_protein [Hexamita inflata]|uniref:Hypothetical_protein n=1 Tax=Hexamita inflata TaxID=28002 RepID=A0AA86RMG0_9EUKA|nr:Hypothetical protein HINF_LOCUS62364 [Hexamita inflata]